MTLCSLQQRFAVPAFWMLLCSAALSLPVWGEQPSAPAGGEGCSISALSLNLHGTRDARAILTALHEAGGLERSDVMLFQEVVRPTENAPGAVDEAARQLGMQIAFAPGFALRGGEQEGLAVLSRFPIVETRVIPLHHNGLLWKSRRRIALVVTLQTSAGQLRVYNLHLDTRVNLKARLEQLRPVAEEATVAPGPILLGGDLNTNPYRWVEHTLPFVVAPDQGSGVLRYMTGLGYASVFPRKTPTSRWFRMQLDWLFLRNLEAGPGTIQPISFSDHHVLSTCLRLASTSLRESALND